MVGVGFGRRGLRPSRSLPVLHTPPHAVEGHYDVGRRGLRAACPEDGPVLAVVLDGPYARGGLDQRLVAVVVVLRRKTGSPKSEVRSRYRRILIQAVGDVGEFSRYN